MYAELGRGNSISLILVRWTRLVIGASMMVSSAASEARSHLHKLEWSHWMRRISGISRINTHQPLGIYGFSVVLTGLTAFNPVEQIDAKFGSLDWVLPSFLERRRKHGGVEFLVLWQLTWSSILCINRAIVACFALLFGCSAWTSSLTRPARAALLR